MADATRYTHGHHESVLRSHTWRTAANSAAYLLPHLRDGMSVLDVGCGPGTITVGLARLVGGAGRVLGVDAAPEALEPARRLARESGLGNVSFTLGEVEELGFPDGTFDVVHAHQLLQHVGDPVAALREMRRVCRPGGLVAARDADYGAMSWFPEVAALEEWQRMYRLVARSNGAEPDAGRRLRSWGRAAGFASVTASGSAWCYASVEEVRWWASLWADRVTASALHGQAVERGIATPAELEEMAAGFGTWAASGDAWFLVPHGELLGRVGSPQSPGSARTTTETLAQRGEDGVGDESRHIPPVSDDLLDE